MGDELTPAQQLAALEGWSCNPMVGMAERLDAAHQVIEGLRAREHERIRTAVADTLRYARVNWISNTAVTNNSGDRQIAEDLASAEEATRSWGMEPGWCCPFCQEVTCDEDCPLARVREELG